MVEDPPTETQSTHIKGFDILNSEPGGRAKCQAQE